MLLLRGIWLDLNQISLRFESWQPWMCRHHKWCFFLNGHLIFINDSHRQRIGGVGGFSKVVATFNHVGRSFNICMATTGDVWIISSFCAHLHVEHVACVITNCGQHQWVIPSPFSTGFSGEKPYQKIIIPIFRLVLQNFAVPDCFPYIPFYRYLFSLLTSDLFVIAVCGSISVRKRVKYLGSL